jgi:hypothetical protein
MFPINRKNLFASVIIFFFFIALFALPAAAQERAGEIIQQFEKKEVVPRDLPDMPVIEQKEEKTQEAPAGPKILIKQINVKMHTKTGGEEKRASASTRRHSYDYVPYENRELLLRKSIRLPMTSRPLTAAGVSSGHTLLSPAGSQGRGSGHRRHRSATGKITVAATHPTAPILSGGIWKKSAKIPPSKQTPCRTHCFC